MPYLESKGIKDYLFVKDICEDVKIDELEILEQIGGGGFALVYRAIWKGREVAVKALFDPNVTPAIKQEFLCELDVMKRLNHPNCIKLFGAGLTPPKLFYVMELLNCSLYDLLFVSNENTTTKMLLGFCCDAAMALEYLHSFSPKIIHRDLKTRNVLLTNDWHIKLCDFGLCNNMNSLVGTPCYMSPEQLKGLPFTHKVDVYSFGLFIFEIFSRTIPFEGLEIKRIKEIVEKGGRPEPRLMKACPCSIVELTKRCWSNDPTERPEFAEIFQILNEVEKDTKEMP